MSSLNIKSSESLINYNPPISEKESEEDSPKIAFHPYAGPGGQEGVSSLGERSIQQRQSVQEESELVSDHIIL